MARLQWEHAGMMQVPRKLSFSAALDRKDGGLLDTKKCRAVQAWCRTRRCPYTALDKFVQCYCDQSGQQASAPGSRQVDVNCTGWPAVQAQNCLGPLGSNFSDTTACAWHPARHSPPRAYHVVALPQGGCHAALQQGRISWPCYLRLSVIRLSLRPW